jgi:hypothetical protein
MESENTRPIGRPPFVATADQRKQVETMAGVGVPHDDIARLIGCSAPTLRKYFEQELAAGTAKANLRVAQTLYRRAIDAKGGRDSVIAGIFWLKCRAGWKEAQSEGGIQGKKEAQAEAADQAAVGKFATPPPPADALN